jgi:hypothetical protein
MKRYVEFTPSGIPFAERVGLPSEFDAAIGQIALGFSFLEDTARNVLVLLSGAHPTVGHIMTAGLSFRQKLDVLSSLSQNHPSLTNDTNKETTDAIRQTIALCRRAEELRNTYVHSSYSDEGGERVKLSHTLKRGFRLVREKVDPALLLDVADYIVYAGMELDSILLLLDVVDAATTTSDSTIYFKQGAVVATFKFGEIK